MLDRIKVGHCQDDLAMTGCTVFMPPEGCSAACEVRGGAPGTRETDLLAPSRTVGCFNALLFTGGSAFGLDAAGGVGRYLEERGEGFNTPAGPVPIVSAAVIFDLDIGEGSVRPGPDMGYKACEAASLDEKRTGNVGAGAGATAGNLLGRRLSTKSGFGTCLLESGALKVEAAAVVNCLGEVVDESGSVIAGVRNPEGGFLRVEELIESAGAGKVSPFENTTLVLIATNGRFDTPGLGRLALQGHNGLARTIRPSHTRYDGDTVFAVATNEIDAADDAAEVLSALAVEGAVRSAVRNTTGAGGLPAACDILHS